MPLSGVLALTYDPIIKEHQAQGIMLVGYTAAPDVIYESKTPIKSTGDISGAKVRSYGLYAEFLKKLGANVITMAFAEVYTSAERGLIEASCPSPFPDAVPRGHHEVMPHFADIGWGSFMVYGPFLSLKTWNSLPADVKGIITELNKEYVDKSAGIWMDDNRTFTEQAKKEGATFSVLSPEQRKEWIKSLDVDGWIDQRLSDIDAQGAPAHEMWAIFLDKIKSYEKQSTTYKTIFDIWTEMGVAE